MRKFIALLLVMTISLLVNAQNLQDVIYLKNGSVIRGTLIEQVPKTKIKTVDGSIWIFEGEEIDRITSEPKQDPRISPSGGDYARVHNYNQAQSAKKTNNIQELTHGLRMMADFSYQEAFNHYSCSAIAFGFSLGWQFKGNYYIGFGLADQGYIDYYYYGTYTGEAIIYTQMPVYGDFRYDFKTGRTSPMIGIRAGYALSGDYQNDYQGVYLNPSLGYRFNRFTISMGLDLVKLKEPWDYTEVDKWGNLTSTTQNWQSSFQFRIMWEWGGRNL